MFFFCHNVRGNTIYVRLERNVKHASLQVQQCAIYVLILSFSLIVIDLVVGNSMHQTTFPLYNHVIYVQYKDKKQYYNTLHVMNNDVNAPIKAMWVNLVEHIHWTLINYMSPVKLNIFLLKFIFNYVKSNNYYWNYQNYIHSSLFGG